MLALWRSRLADQWNQVSGWSLTKGKSVAELCTDDFWLFFLAGILFWFEKIPISLRCQSHWLSSVRSDQFLPLLNLISTIGILSTLTVGLLLGVRVSLLVACRFFAVSGYSQSLRDWSHPCYRTTLSLLTRARRRF